MSWVSFIDKNAKQFPKKTALIEQATERRLTYKELREEVDSWANFLRSKNIGMGERVVFLHTNCLEHLVLFLACARLGAIFVPLNWRLADREKLTILSEIQPKLVIYKKDCNLEHPFETLSIGDETNINLKEHSFPDVPLQEPLLMLFTSGTTGDPKGVLLHGEMLKSNQEQTSTAWKLVKEDITLVETPFFHTGGYNVLSLPLLLLGGTVILSEKFDAKNVLETIPSQKISVYFGVPTMFQLIYENSLFKKADLSSLRFLISGGAHCPEDLIKGFQRRKLFFKQGFGLTEVGPNCFLLEEKDSLRKLGSIGRPMPHSQVKLIKENQEEAEDGVEGELYIAGPHVCAGYYQQDKAFEQAKEGPFFRTGDLARRDDEGFYYIVGRKKDMYISGGENVYPAEVEKELNMHPSINQAIVVPRPHQQWGEVGHAFIQSKKEIHLDELRVYLTPLLSRYKHPHTISYLEDFPLLDNGKINRQYLKKNVLTEAIQ